MAPADPPIINASVFFILFFKSILLKKLFCVGTCPPQSNIRSASLINSSAISSVLESSILYLLNGNVKSNDSNVTLA